MHGRDAADRRASLSTNVQGCTCKSQPYAPISGNASITGRPNPRPVAGHWCEAAAQDWSVLSLCSASNDAFRPTLNLTRGLGGNVFAPWRRVRTRRARLSSLISMTPTALPAPGRSNSNKHGSSQTCWPDWLQMCIELMKCRRVCAIDLLPLSPLQSHQSSTFVNLVYEVRNKHRNLFHS